MDGTAGRLPPAALRCRRAGMARKAAIVGVADTPLRQGVLAEDGTVLQIQARAAKTPLDEAGLSFGDVDGLFAAGAWGVPRPRLFMPVTLAEYLRIKPRSLDRTQIGGSPLRAPLRPGPPP